MILCGTGSVKLATRPFHFQGLSYIKALEFAGLLDIADFKASNGWLEKFKGRHAIKAFTVSDKSAGVDLQTKDFCSRIPEICSDFEPCNIFNCDETGLYYRALPDKTLSAKGASCKGVKNSKERLTIMFACSATGEKLKPLVISKVLAPRCVRGICNFCIDIRQNPINHMAIL